MARSLPVENLQPQNVGSIIILSTTCSNATEAAYGEITIAVDHSQLLAMASETVDSIDWTLPPTLHRAVPPELHELHDRCKCRLQIIRLAAPTGKLTCDLGYARPTLCLCSHSGYEWTPLSVSLWNDLADPVVDCVGLAGFKSRENVFLLAQSARSLIVF